MLRLALTILHLARNPYIANGVRYTLKMYVFTLYARHTPYASGLMRRANHCLQLATPQQWLGLGGRRHRCGA